jgi:hypothetical protein
MVTLLDEMWSSRVDLDYVAVRQSMLTPDVLSIESALAPHARVLERAREVFVHEPSDVLHRLTVAEHERSIPRRRPARHLRVDPCDPEMGEEPGANRVETLPRRR